MAESATLDATDGPMEPETPCSWILGEYATTNHNIRTEKKNYLAGRSRHWGHYIPCPHGSRNSRILNILWVNPLNYNIFKAKNHLAGRNTAVFLIPLLE